MKIKTSVQVYLFYLIVFVFLIQSCQRIEPQSPEADSVMNSPVDGMTFAQNRLFNTGAEEFDEVYTSESGLGPIFVATACAGCHTGDNRGHVFTILTRFGQEDTTGNKFLELGGPQIQNRALPGVKPEILPQGVTSSKFIAPIVAGVGFLELVSDADILAMADPGDINNDGITGIPNWSKIPSWLIPNPNAISQNGRYITRFGRKAAAYNLHHQTVNAFNQDMGITTTFLPMNPLNYTEGLSPVPTADPEVSDQSVNSVVFYLQALNGPIQRNQSDATVKHGETVFKQIGCESCHKQNLKTGYSPIKALSYKEFHPYTDLLLHDMGNELDDGYTEGSALTSEWRTTPLWGLGLAPDAQGGNYNLMHDGRAESIQEAIILHGGEASNSQFKYIDLSANDKAALIDFLKSL